MNNHWTLPFRMSQNKLQTAKIRWLPITLGIHYVEPINKGRKSSTTNLEHFCNIFENLSSGISEFAHGQKSAAYDPPLPCRLARLVAFIRRDKVSKLYIMTGARFSISFRLLIVVEYFLLPLQGASWLIKSWDCEVGALNMPNVQLARLLNL